MSSFRYDLKNTKLYFTLLYHDWTQQLPLEEDNRNSEPLKVNVHGFVAVFFLWYLFSAHSHILLRQFIYTSTLILL